MFGALFVGFGLIGEWRDGVIEAERVSPAPRSALVLGRVLRDVIVVAVQGVVLVSVAFLFGLEAPFWGIVLGIVTAALLAAAFASASYAVALTLKSEDALAPLMNGVALPLLLLSGILLPITAASAPAWLNTLSNLNPIKHVVSGIRAQFDGDIGSADRPVGLRADDRARRRSASGSAPARSSARTADRCRPATRGTRQRDGRAPPRPGGAAVVTSGPHSTPSSTSTARRQEGVDRALGVARCGPCGGGTSRTRTSAADSGVPLSK